jgi:hypothetical protein
MRVLLVALGIALASAAKAATGAAAVPVHFAPAQGWHSGFGSPKACPGVSAARCTQQWLWTGTVAWKDCPNCLPHRTATTLPRNGVVISALIVSERPVVARQRVPWPVRVRARNVVAGFDGLPGRLGIYQLFARVGKGREIRLTVHFGRRQPTLSQIRKANARLAAVSLD